MERIALREIGSEFWSIPTIVQNNKLFPNNVQWYLSGRSALSAILKSNCFRTASLPIWCCDSIIKPFLDANIQISFYSVNGAEQNVCGLDSDVLLVMDYFGFSGYSSVPQNYKGVVIRDLTHSLFSAEYDDADYYFGSLRKWAGFYSGGFAWSKEGLLPEAVNNCYEVIELRKKAMSLKSDYMKGTIDNKDYLRLFAEAESILDSNDGYYTADQADIENFNHLDLEQIRKKRRENAEVLINELNAYCVFTDLKPDDCPLFVPIVVKHRDELRKRLISKSIYCPIHWSVSNIHPEEAHGLEIYQNEISLVCDQRYGTEDMNRIVLTVEEGI